MAYRLRHTAYTAPNNLYVTCMHVCVKTRALHEAFTQHTSLQDHRYKVQCEVACMHFAHASNRGVRRIEPRSEDTKGHSPTDACDQPLCVHSAATARAPRPRLRPCHVAQ
eukprot:scaffold23363_cov161-Isochrysis_galbana.AAC.3